MTVTQGHPERVTACGWSLHTGVTTLHTGVTTTTPTHRCRFTPSDPSRKKSRFIRWSLRGDWVVRSCAGDARAQAGLDSTTAILGFFVGLSWRGHHHGGGDSDAASWMDLGGFIFLQRPCGYVRFYVRSLQWRSVQRGVVRRRIERLRPGRAECAPRATARR